MVYQDFINIIKNSKNIYVTGHVNPDGDCIGAVMAMVMILKSLGIKSQGVLEVVPSMYNYMPIKQHIINDAKNHDIDTLIVLDSGAKDRIGCGIENYKTLINIDHHVSNTIFGDYNLVDIDASSTCEAIYKFIENQVEINDDIAMAIYTGIVYDTGCFKHSCTNTKTHSIVSELIKYKFDFTEIINRLFYYNSVIGLQAKAKAIENISLYNDNRIAISFLTFEDLERISGNKEHIENIVQMLLEIIGVECSVFIYELEKDKNKVSFRSKGIVNVCEIAKEYNGGGHIKAAGCTIVGDKKEIIKELVNKISRQL